MILAGKSVFYWPPPMKPGHVSRSGFCRVHQTLRVTPAMEARLTDHVWTLVEVVALIPD
jgi:hypothetical protein